MEYHIPEAGEPKSRALGESMFGEAQFLSCFICFSWGLALKCPISPAQY